MRVGNSAKPFEHFLEAIVIILIAVNLTAVILLALGVIKAPGSRSFRESFQTPPPLHLR